jgi:hypothetical protein
MAKLDERHIFAIRETVDNVLRRRSLKLYQHVADLIGAWITDECTKKCFLPCHTVKVTERHDRLLPKQVEHSVDGGFDLRRWFVPRLKMVTICQAVWLP